MTAHPPRAGLRAAVADALRDDIARGRHAPGDRLPTEGDIARRFGVHRHTARAALSLLAEEGLLFSRRGAGRFVAARPTEYPLGRRVRFEANLRAAGGTPARRILALATRAADAAEAAALGLAPGDPVHLYEGLSLADGEPIAIFRSVFPAAGLPDLPRHLADLGSVTAALARSGVADYSRASTRLVAKVATTTQAALLRLPEPAALLRATSLNVGDNRLPVEHGTTWFAGDRVALTVADADGT